MKRVTSYLLVSYGQIVLMLLDVMNPSLTGDVAIVLIAISVPVALWLDKLLGEPSRYHPLVGFGWWASKVEDSCRKITFVSPLVQGCLAWVIAVVPLVVITLLISVKLANIHIMLWFVFNTLIGYLALGGTSLIQHADNIYQPLKTGDLESARYQLSMIVSRNTEQMNEKEIVSSTVESVLENGNDAVFAPMVWMVLLGAPGAVLLRLANTLDAMWGYKTEHYLLFGRCSAKIDDLLGWLPARLTAIVYAFQGDIKQGFHCWKHQAKQCASPNGGVVMTTGAGSLNIKIGGPTYYHGLLHDKKVMGVGEVADWRAIFKANQLVTRGSMTLSYIWLVTVLVGVS